MPDGGEHAFDRMGSPEVVPVLGREVEEGEELLPVPLQAGDGLRVLRPVLLHERVEREGGCRPVGRTGDLVQVPLDLRRHGIRHRVEDVTTLCTQQRWWQVDGNTSSRAFQKPRAPSPTASSGATASPRAFKSTSSSRQLWALSRVPTWKPTSSFLPSGVAPITTSMHSAVGSMRAWR